MDRTGELEMKKWYFIIDVEKCENCQNCFLACKDEFAGNDWPVILLLSRNMVTNGLTCKKRRGTISSY